MSATETKSDREPDREDLALIDQLFREAPSFEFFQAMRLLARRSGRVPIGETGPPQSETVRLGALPSLSFPPSAIHALDLVADKNAPPRMTVTFIGLIGPSGVLPRHYTNMLV